MQKIFDLGKVHYNGRGRVNPVTIEMRLSDGGELTICGNIWNNRKSDIYCGGQCLDTIAKYLKDMSPQNREMFRKLYILWRKYHLNRLRGIVIPEDTMKYIKYIMK